MAKYVVRYGAMRFLGICSAHGSAIYHRDTRVIARTERGLEAAVVLTEATETARTVLKEAGEGQILRAMTIEDENELLRIGEQARRELDVCQALRRPAGAGDGLGRGGANIRRRTGGGLLPGREPRRFSRVGPPSGRRVPDADRDAADRRPRRGQAAGRLRRLRQANLLQQPPRADAAGLDADGEAAEGHLGPDQDLGTLRPPEMLPPL